MKSKEFREMTTPELENKLKELKSQHFNLRFSHETGQLSNPMMLNTVKKAIARVMTILRERELETAKSNKEAQ